MATKKAASTKKTTAKKPVAKPAKTTVRTVSASAKPTVKVVEKSQVKTTRPVAAEHKSQALPGNTVNIVLAEIFGTFALVLVALFAAKETGALYVGLLLAVMFMAVGAVSGAHLNPAVTFAKWTMRQLKGMLVPIYWAAQMVGALLAFVVINAATGNALHLSFDHIGSMNWAIFTVELVGAAVFMFGFAAATTRRTLSTGASAIGVGLSLTVGLVVAASLLANVQGAVDTSKLTSVENVPHELRIKGATLNPAVALVATEISDSGLNGMRAEKGETQMSRFSLEVLLGTMIGAVLGGNLYLLTAGRRRDQ